MRFSTSTILAASALIGSVSAHTRVFSLWVDGVDQGSGAGVYIRQPPTNNPTKDLTSSNVACNENGLTAVSGTVTVKPGSKVEPEWFHNTRGDDILDPSHSGPIVAYLAKASTNGVGNVWSKISEDGFDGTAWASNRMINNKGKHTVVIPKDLAAGDYILRVEVLALHESDTLFSQNSARGIQLYPSCTQITVAAGGSADLPTGVAFPGAYTDADPGIHFNLYGSAASSYIIPGPAVVSLVAGSGGSAPTSSPAAAATSTKAATPSSSSKPVSSSVPVVVSSSSVAAPVTTSIPASVPTTSSVVATKPTTTSSVPSKPTTTSSAPSKPATTSSVAPKPTTTASVAPPATTSAVSPPASTEVITDANVCWRIYNKCLDASQPHPDFTGCSASRDSCVSSVRARRSGTLGRRAF